MVIDSQRVTIRPNGSTFDKIRSIIIVLLFGLNSREFWSVGQLPDIEPNLLEVSPSAGQSVASRNGDIPALSVAKCGFHCWPKYGIDGSNNIKINQNNANNLDDYQIGALRGCMEECISGDMETGLTSSPDWPNGKSSLLPDLYPRVQQTMKEKTVPIYYAKWGIYCIEWDNFVKSSTILLNKTINLWNNDLFWWKII